MLQNIVEDHEVEIAGRQLVDHVSYIADQDSVEGLPRPPDRGSNDLNAPDFASSSLLQRAAEVAVRATYLEDCPDANDLLRIQSRNSKLLDACYTWDRFTAQVIEAIESPLSPPLGREGPVRRARLISSEWASPIGPIRRRTYAAFRRLRRAMRSPDLASIDVSSGGRDGVAPL